MQPMPAPLPDGCPRLWSASSLSMLMTAPQFWLLRYIHGYRPQHDAASMAAGRLWGEAANMLDAGATREQTAVAMAASAARLGLDYLPGSKRAYTLSNLLRFVDVYEPTAATVFEHEVAYALTPDISVRGIFDALRDDTVVERKATAAGAGAPGAWGGYLHSVQARTYEWLLWRTQLRPTLTYQVAFLDDKSACVAERTLLVNAARAAEWEQIMLCWIDTARFWLQRGAAAGLWSGAAPINPTSYDHWRQGDAATYGELFALPPAERERLAAELLRKDNTHGQR